MATRFYYDLTISTPPPILPAIDPEWDDPGYTRQYCLVRTKNNDPMNTLANDLVGVNGADVMWSQFVCADTLSAQTISGTVKGVMLMWEWAAGNNCQAACSIRVVTPAGATRGTLLSWFPSSLTDEVSAVDLYSRYLPEETALTPVASQAGDYLVVEIGFRQFSTMGAGNEVDFTIGCDGAVDLDYNETQDPTAYYNNPWIEFSLDISFGGSTETGIRVEDDTKALASKDSRLKWSDILVRMRRYLRDPDGLIWTDAELQQYFNDSAHEICTKIWPLVMVESFYFPPEYDGSYFYDWEVNYGSGTQYQAMHMNQADIAICFYPWEAAYWLSSEPLTDDEGYRDIHPWEMVMGTPGDVVPVPLHHKFHRMKILAYDEEPVDPIDENHLQQQDRYYRSRVGKPIYYYRLDENQNRIVLYPRPSVVWDETEIYEILDDDGGVVDSEDRLTDRDTGVTFDVVNTINTIFMIYEVMPQELQNLSDVNDMARWMIKYAEYAALERAYSADTDGFIPSLRDYWGQRKKIGIEVLKRWKRLGMLRRDHRLGGGNLRSRGRHVKLPDHYPQVT